MRYVPYRYLLFTLAFSLVFSGVTANDFSANQKFKAGLEAFESGNYRDAGQNFLDAEILADTVSLKAKAVKEAALSFQKAGLLYREFECIEKLLCGYPGYINYAEYVDREYVIGDTFFQGHRDPSFWSLRWVPWLTEPDRSITIYEKAVEHAPFSNEAPRAKLRLACMYIDDGKIDKSLKLLRDIVSKHPTSPECKFAYLELGSALFQLAQKGDGDGSYNNEAIKVFQEFLKKYPNDPECDWVKKSLLKTKDISAQRLYGMARFYHRIGRDEPAERYLTEVLNKYPDTIPVDESEAMLTKIDKQYLPANFYPAVESREQGFKRIPIPAEESKILVAPENSGGKWLLPIKDVGLGGQEEVNIKTTGKGL